MGWLALVLGILLIVIFPRQMLAIAGFLILLAVSGFVLISNNNNKNAQEQKQVSVSVRYDASSCQPEFPLFVTVQNFAHRTVTNIRWEPEAYRPGYSSNVIQGYLSGYSADKILKTGEMHALCFKAPTLAGDHKGEDLVWKVIHKYAHFVD